MRLVLIGVILYHGCTSQEGSHGSISFQQRAIAFNNVQLNFFYDGPSEWTHLTGQPDFGWDMPDKPFLTIGEVADILQVSSRTVYDLIYKGRLRFCRITYHITLITKEDFFLMIKETTYCKRSVSIFARLGKKTKKKMNGERQGKEQTSLIRQEGKKKTKDSPTNPISKV